MTEPLAPTLDAETGLLTRAELVERFEQEVARSERYGLTCAFVLVRVNDYLAMLREAPDDATRVLERMTWLIRLGSRRYDLGCRWSEDIFGLLLPHVGNSGARTRVQRMENAAAAAEQDKPEVSLYAVVVAFPEHGASVGELVAAAEKGLGVR